MQLQEVFQSLADHASVKTIYGEPVVAGNKTIVPVARVFYGFGGGSGTHGKPETQEKGEGGGGGGGFSVRPVGFIEITPERTRFVPLNDRKRLAGAAGLGVVLGLFLAWRRSCARRRMLEKAEA